MLKIGNTFVNFGGTYLTGHTKYIPPADWREVFHTYSAGDSYSYGNTNNECLWDGNFEAPYASAYTQIDTNSSSHKIYEGTGPDASASTTNFMGNLTFEEPEKIKYLLVHGEWAFQDVGGHWGNVNNLTNALKTNQKNSFWAFGISLGGVGYSMYSVPDSFTDQKITNKGNGRYYCYEGSKRYYFNDNELCPWYERNGSPRGQYFWTPNLYNMLIKLEQDKFSVSCYSNINHWWSAVLGPANTAIPPTGFTATTSTLDNPRIYFYANNCGNHNGSDYWSYCSYITPNFGVSACYSDELNLEQLYRLTNKDYLH